jgi:uncharacterized protein (DUF2235 family)
VEVIIMALYAFDGTWREDEIDDEKDSNVRRFHDAYEGNKVYVPGIGTRFGKLGRALGGAIGTGGRTRVLEMYEALKGTYRSGDHVIDIVGFSRGAALALHFANRIHSEGPIGPGETAAPQIRFLGLWDVVASFGLPGNDINLGWDLELPPSVTTCVHGMALDERRGTFAPTRVKGAYEVWFRGVHSDVGGGNQNVKLSNIALRWMMRRAIQAGVPVNPKRIPTPEMIDTQAAIRPAGFDPIKDPYRVCAVTDRCHYTVSPRADCNNPPAGVLVERELDEWPERFATA